jgi:hypothetical protein
MFDIENINYHLFSLVITKNDFSLIVGHDLENNIVLLNFSSNIIYY